MRLAAQTAAGDGARRLADVLLLLGCRAGAVLVAGANVAAAIALHRFARRFWGQGTALVAAGLFGVFPLAVWSSRLGA